MIVPPSYPSLSSHHRVRSGPAQKTGHVDVEWSSLEVGLSLLPNEGALKITSPVTVQTRVKSTPRVNGLGGGGRASGYVELVPVHCIDFLNGHDRLGRAPDSPTREQKDLDYD